MVKLRVEELGGARITAYDQNGNAVEIRIAEKSDKFKNKSGKFVPVNKDLATKYNKNAIKQESVVLADELIRTAEYSKSSTAKYPHGWLDDNGKNMWEKWTTFVQDKNNAVWKATLHIANSANGEKILYDIDQIKMVEQSGTSDTSTTTTNVPQTAPNSQAQNNQKRSSVPIEIDSTGRMLSAQQQEYFKDSKVRDKKGNLKVMYHGTPKGGFTVFDPSAVGSTSDFGYLGRGFYFTAKENVAKYYAGYLTTSEIKKGYKT